MANAGGPLFFGYFLLKYAAYAAWCWAGLKLLDVLDGPVRDAGNAVMRPIGVAGQKQLVALLDRLRAALDTAEHLK